MCVCVGYVCMNMCNVIRTRGLIRCLGSVDQERETVSYVRELVSYSDKGMSSYVPLMFI